MCHSDVHTFTLGPDFSSQEAWDHNRLDEYIPTIMYEAESPDEAALVEVIYPTCTFTYHIMYVHVPVHIP